MRIYAFWPLATTTKSILTIAFMYLSLNWADSRHQLENRREPQKAVGRLPLVQEGFLLKSSGLQFLTTEEWKALLILMNLTGSLSCYQNSKYLCLVGLTPEGWVCEAKVDSEAEPLKEQIWYINKEIKWDTGFEKNSAF